MVTEITEPAVHNQANSVHKETRSWLLHGSWLKRHPELWVALALFVASNIFAVTFAKFARWQYQAPYYKTADFCRWDCTWFRVVVNEGYDRSPYRYGDKADWSFFPLFPLAGAAIKHALGIPAPLSLVLAGKCALYASILAFLLMVRNHLDSMQEFFMAGSLVAFNPYVIYGHAGYSEPLYFALSALAFFWLAEKRWIQSGAAGALLSATRIVGILFLFSYLVSSLKEVQVRRLLRERNLPILLGFLLCPLGMAVYMFYLYHRTGDALAFIHIQVGWHRAPGNPFVVLARALRQHGWPRIWGVMGLAGLAVVGWLLRERRQDLAIFLTGAVLIPLSADTWGFARYLWWQPPLLYAIFILLKRHRSWWGIYAAFAGGMAALMIMAWFSGSNIVI